MQLVVSYECITSFSLALADDVCVVTFEMRQAIALLEGDNFMTQDPV